MQENVKKCTHFASASGGLRPPDSLPGLCPWTPLGDFRPPDPLAPPPPHCKILGTPMPYFTE